MMLRLTTAGLLLLVLGASRLSMAADAAAGKAAFREQCALCHSAEPGDGGGAQGPSLHNIFGRRAADAPSFPYTQALRNSGLTWNAATLERFLASPTKIVPGTAMVVAMPDAIDRDNLVAYFKALQEGTPKEAAKATPGISREALQAFLTGFGCNAPVARAEKLLQSSGDATALLAALGCSTTRADSGRSDWKNDAPGRVYRIDAMALPQPFATPAAALSPKVVARPAGAKLLLPKGFQAQVFASGLQGPRTLRVAPNGDVFVAEPRMGRVKVMRPERDGSKARVIATFAQGLVEPYGIQFDPQGAQPRWVYIAENNRVVRYAYRVGDMEAAGVPDVVVPSLAPQGRGGHSTRDIAFSADGRQLFVAVGSQSNIGEGMGTKTVDEAKQWEAQHGLGAAWGHETNRAAVLVFEVGSNEPGKIFASGIRNCVGLTLHPASGDLWCTTNERDMLGDDLVPDYSTRVVKGGFYGWPWYYIGNHEDPRLKGHRPDLAGKAMVPDVLYQAHSAALSMVFYTNTAGRSAFPKEYLGDGFAVLHGSWNRTSRVGHKVVRVRMKEGRPTGEYEDFLVGFIIDDANVWGRPAAAEVASDGALLISDDGGGVIHRISYPQR